MTTISNIESNNECPAQQLLKALSGKWKPQIFRLAVAGPLRFNALLRDIEGTSKQSLAQALRELEEDNLLLKTTISAKPLHIEYTLTERGRMLIPVFEQLEVL